MNAIPQSDDNVREIEPLLNVTDMDRSLRYYMDGLGFKMTKKWVKDGKIRWCLLELGSTKLMLGANASPWKPEGKIGDGLTLCFICKDALALYDGFKSRGIKASEPEVGNAMWYTTLHDPDGYSIWFESTTDVPEDTKLSQVRPASK